MMLVLPGTQCPATPLQLFNGSRKYAAEVPPGLHFKIPFGIDVTTLVPVKRQLKQEFGFTTPGGLRSLSEPDGRSPRDRDGAGVIAASSAVYTVGEVEQAIITQFGKPVGAPITEAGLKLKLPFIQEVTALSRHMPSSLTLLSSQRKAFCLAMMLSSMRS